MLTKIRNRQKGFTLIELLIVVAIIGIIAALLIPNFLDALQKAKQKRTVADMRNAGTAMFSWLTDQVGAAAAGAAATTVDLGTYTASDATTVGLGPGAAVPAGGAGQGRLEEGLRTTGSRPPTCCAAVMASRSGGRDASTPSAHLHGRRLRSDRLRPGHRLGRRLLRPLAAEDQLSSRRTGLTGPHEPKAIQALLPRGPRDGDPPFVFLCRHFLRLSSARMPSPMPPSRLIPPFLAALLILSPSLRRAVRHRLGRARGAVGAGRMAAAVPADRHLEPAWQRGAGGGLPGRHPRSGRGSPRGWSRTRRGGPTCTPGSPSPASGGRAVLPAPSHGRGRPRAGVDACRRSPAWSRAGGSGGAARSTTRASASPSSPRWSISSAGGVPAGARRHLPRRGRRGERRRARARAGCSPTIRSSSRGSRR